MKLYSLLVLLFLAINSHAQNFSNTGSGLNDLSRFMDDSTGEETLDDEGITDETEIATNDPLNLVAMNATESWISFENLPEKGNTIAHITNANGEELFAKTVNTKKASIAVNRLPNELLFVTLIYKNYRKAFDINRAKREEAAQKNKPAQ